jgi:hypothetical protein
MTIAGVAPGVTGVPIVIYSFDRPEYLERVCRGLLAQAQVRPDPARVFLLQDGAVSARTGHRFGRPLRMKQCVDLFRDLFPEGQVLAAQHNIGMAENILRGQRHVFETLDEEIGFFFEDDLEPGPLYLAALEAMRAATEPFAGQVGYFAAYGTQVDPKPGPEVNVIQLGHQWGYGLRREAWRRIQAVMPAWWEEARRVDFQGRNRLRLLRIFLDWDVAVNNDAEDGATSLACATLGLARLNTDVSFARYIGEHGEHFNPAVFRRLGFEGMRWAEAPRFVLRAPDAAEVALIAETARAGHAHYRRNQFPKLLATLEASQEDPDRLATEAEIRALWHLLLDQREVPAPYIERHAGRTTIRALRREIVRRDSFQRSTGP